MLRQTTSFSSRSLSKGVFSLLSNVSSDADPVLCVSWFHLSVLLNRFELVVGKPVKLALSREWNTFSLPSCYCWGFYSTSPSNIHLRTCPLQYIFISHSDISLESSFDLIIPLNKNNIQASIQNNVLCVTLCS